MDSSIMKLNIKIYYHNDMDGECSRVIVEKYLRERYKNDMGYDVTIKSYFLDHSEHDEEKIKEVDGSENDVVILDYSFTDSTLNLFKYIYEKIDSNNFIWIDHYDSSIKFVEDHIATNFVDANLHDRYYIPNRHIYVSKMASAALLTWDFYFNGYDNSHPRKIDSPIDVYADNIPTACHYVSDYDTFSHLLPYSNYFKLGYDAADDKHAFFFELFNFDGCFNSYNPNHNPNQERHARLCNDAISNGKAIYSYIMSENNRIIEASGYESFLPKVTGYFEEIIPIYVCNCMGNSWVFGDLYNNYEYVVVWFFDGSEYRYSIFSNLKKFPNANCAKYAEYFGGGGQKGAAGWRDKHLLFEDGAFIMDKASWYRKALTEQSKKMLQRQPVADVKP